MRLRLRLMSWWGGKNNMNKLAKSISRYETEATMSSIETLVKISKKLKKTSEVFLEEEGIMKILKEEAK